ncbi:hypothetical protein [Kibdelosporangium philippinense]|uniref:hypothetical protein n=1 Tax=Kibdelosporangium philippinense TaxID=211113 RepID=UPI00360FB121
MARFDMGTPRDNATDLSIPAGRKRRQVDGRRHFMSTMDGLLSHKSHSPRASHLLPGLTP